MFTIPPLPSLPRNEQIARSLLLHGKRSFEERVTEHIERFRNFWDDEETTPNEICIGLGSQGQAFLGAAAESVNHITRLVMGSGYDSATEAERYAALSAVIPPDFFVPRMPFQFLQGGEIRVVQLEGFDAWGRPIETPPAE